jgi:dihydrofolate reductase
MGRADTLLLGRKTWQTHGGAFEPMAPGDPFGDVMNAFRKVVVSTTLKSAAAWRNSSLISRDAVEEVRKLKAQSGKSILVDGSSVLIHTLAENDLIDEYHLHVYPLVLGSGKRLFPPGKRQNLRLARSHALPTGVLFQEYQTVK